jgi:hypothetical protein
MLPDDGINKNYLLAREDFYFVYPTASTSTSASTAAPPARRHLARGDGSCRCSP